MRNWIDQFSRIQLEDNYFCLNAISTYQNVSVDLHNDSVKMNVHFLNQTLVQKMPSNFTKLKSVSLSPQSKYEEYKNIEICKLMEPQIVNYYNSFTEAGTSYFR